MISDDEAQLKRVKDPAFDPEHTVILPAMAQGLELNAGVPGNSDSKVEWGRPSPNRVELKVRSSQPGVLILSQVFYPGWEVFVDGVQRPILRVNYALTGVAIASGARSVKFVYNPESYRIGRAVSLVSIIGLAAVCIYWRKREPQSSGGDRPEAKASGR